MFTYLPVSGQKWALKLLRIYYKLLYIIAITRVSQFTHTRAYKFFGNVRKTRGLNIKASKWNAGDFLVNSPRKVWNFVIREHQIFKTGVAHFLYQKTQKKGLTHFQKEELTGICTYVFSCKVLMWLCLSFVYIYSSKIICRYRKKRVAGMFGRWSSFLRFCPFFISHAFCDAYHACDMISCDVLMKPVLVLFYTQKLRVQ